MGLIYYDLGKLGVDEPTKKEMSHCTTKTICSQLKLKSTQNSFLRLKKANRCEGEQHNMLKDI